MFDEPFEARDIQLVTAEHWHDQRRNNATERWFGSLHRHRLASAFGFDNSSSCRGLRKRINSALSKATAADTIKATENLMPRSRIQPSATVAPAPTLMLTMFMKP